MPEAQVRGVRLFYEERGSGAPILCIHGGGSSAVLWEDAAERLAGCGRVIIYDRRGCGRSERPAGYDRTTVAEQADDAADLVDALGASPAVVIARSYGGAVALDLALRHGDHVRALALLEPDALGLSPAGLEWTRGLRARLLDVVAAEGMEVVPAKLIDDVAGRGTWQTFSEPVRRALTENAPALLAELSYVDEPMPDAQAVARIDKPVLLVEASDSPREQRGMVEALAAALPSARRAVVAGGHLVDPASREVIGFLREVLAPA